MDKLLCPACRGWLADLGAHQVDDLAIAGTFETPSSATSHPSNLLRADNGKVDAPPPMHTRVFRLQHASAADAMNLLDGLMGKTPDLAITSDKRLNAVFARGSTDKIDEIEARIKQHLKSLFGCRHAEVRSISGTMANDAVISKFVNHGDVVMVNSTPAGGN